MWWVAVWLLACGGADPELVAQREAVDAWRLGKTALKEGNAEAARQHFEAAKRARPGDALLWVWEAEALRALGETDEARARLEEAVRRSPALAEAHYNLAALHALSGNAEAAAIPLKRALDLGAAEPEAVASDPDFAAVLAHSALSFLPRRELNLSWSGPDGSVFWGSQVPLSLTVSGGDEGLSIRGALSGPVELLRVVERRSQDTVEVEWTVQVRGSGEVVVGPIEVESGGRVATQAQVQIQALAPDDRGTGQVWNWPLSGVRARGAQRGQPSASWDPSGLWVRVGPADQMAVSPAGGQWIRHEYREQGQVQWTLVQILGLPKGEATVDIVQASGESWKQSVVVGTEIPVGEAKGGGPG